MVDRPNIMILVGEDIGRYQGCYGDPIGHTPTIDRLAAEGARYTNAFSTAPVCAPSRGAAWSSQIAFSAGFHHMRSRLLQPPRMFTENLRESGYYVNWANKQDFNYAPPDSFADAKCEWFDALAEGKLPDQPWLLYYNFTVTHESRMWRDKWEREVRPFLADDQLCDPNTVRAPAYLPDTPEVRADIARNYDSLRLQDMQITQAIVALEQSGQADNTIVIYMSDHGRGLIREKRWTYDVGIHLPLIIRAPGLIEPGTVSHELVSWLDIAPTILSLCHAKPLEKAQGRVFLGPEATPPGDYVFAHRDRMGPVFDRARAARSERYLYVRQDFPGLPHAAQSDYMEKQATTASAREEFAAGRLNDAQRLWFAETKPEEEFFDCETDPDCVHNLAADPAMAEILAAHRRALTDFIERVGDHGLRTESEMVDSGELSDMLPVYYGQRKPLPERYRIGRELAPVQLSDV